jgi:thioredoxin 1
MISRRSILVSALLVSLAPLPALARDVFSEKAFDAAAASGSPVLIEFHAEWCPTCRAQEKVINSFKFNPEYKGLVILRVDYDTEKSLLKRFKVRRQSTLVMFKKGAELARAVGQTSPEGIKSLLNTAF